MSALLHQARPSSVPGAVYYAAPSDEPLYCYADDPPPGEREHNVEFVPHTVMIRDARHASRPLRLDREGATIWCEPSAVRNFYDDEELRRVGYPEAAAIVSAVSGAQHVVVFDHNVRRAGDGAGARQAAKKPVFHAHTDFTTASAPVRARSVLDAALTSGRRIAELNVWRPIAGPVRDNHLALCDASSLDADDLVPVALLYPERTGEIYYVRFNSAHRWWYLSDMRTDEAWVFKNYDSATDGRARFTPHTAFLDPHLRSAAPARESVEFRAFAIFDA